jgi:type III pantothenate kinase
MARTPKPIFRPADRTRRLTPADALLAVDVGNSRIGVAIWDDDGLHDSLRLAHETPNEWEPALADIWQQTGSARHRAVVIGSVAPRTARRFADLVERVCDAEPLFIRRDVPLPMRLDIENAREVGIDRICSAAAAYERVGSACAVASFGTATTIDCVSRDGVFLGGAILPGLQMSCDALHDRTEKLPRVAPAKPQGPFGRNTHDAIVNGVGFGLAGALREIVERFATALNEWPELIVTGGDAAMIATLADFVDYHVPDLCLMGVALAYRKAAGQP